jgi:hypothetical protein
MKKIILYVFLLTAIHAFGNKYGRSSRRERKRELKEVRCPKRRSNFKSGDANSGFSLVN